MLAVDARGEQGEVRGRVRHSVAMWPHLPGPRRPDRLAWSTCLMPQVVAAGGAPHYTPAWTAADPGHSGLIPSGRLPVPAGTRKRQPATKWYPGIICSCPVFERLPTCAPLRTGRILRLCYMKIDAPVSVYAGTLTPRTSTTGAERSARFVPTARVGGQVSGRSCASSKS